MVQPGLAAPLPPWPGSIHPPLCGVLPLVNRVSCHPLPCWGCAGVGRRLCRAEHRLQAPGVQHTFLAGAGDRAGVWLGPAHRAACSASSRAGERFRQPGRPAEQRREVKPAWVNGDNNPARLCFIALPLRQQVPAGRDWELVLLLGVAELVNC